MSQMQELLDKAAVSARVDPSSAVPLLIEAIKLLSRGQQQVMQELEQHKNSSIHDAGIRIGSGL